MKRVILAAACLLTGIHAQDPSETGALAGYILDPLGEAVPAARVRIMGWGHESEAKLIAETLSDPSGYFSVRGLSTAKGLVIVRATAKGFHVGHSYKRPLAGKTPGMIDVQLWAAADISGVVRGEDGEPLKGVEVTGAFDAARGFHFDEYSRSISDSEGRYHLEKVPLGDIHIRASTADYEMFEQEMYLSTDATSDFKMKKGSGASLRVRVVGVPAGYSGELKATFLGYHSNYQVLPMRLTDGVLDAKHIWEVRGLPVGFKLGSIRVAGKGLIFEPKNHEVKTLSGEHAVEFRAIPVDDKTQATSTLKGQLLDQKGKPLAAQRINIRVPRRKSIETSTDESGHFEVPVAFVSGDRMRLYLVDSDWHLAQEPTQSRSGGWELCEWMQRFEPASQVTLRARRGHRVSGILLGEQGIPLRGVELTLESDENMQMSMSGRRSYVDRVTTGVDGSFEMRGVPNLERQLWLKVEHRRGFVDHGPFTGNVNKVVEVRLTKPAVVEGVVLDAAGKPVVGARVWLRDWDMERQRQGGGRVNERLTDSRGRFRYPALAAAGYYACVVKKRKRSEELVRTDPFEIAVGKTKKIELRIGQD